MRAHRALLPALAAAALLFGAACSSDGSDGASTTTAPRSTTTADGDGATTTTEADSTTTTEADSTTTTEPGDGPATTTGGGEPIDEDAQAYVDTLADAIQSSDASSAFPPEQTRCLAEGFVAGVGADRLAAEGITPEEFAKIGGIEGPQGLDIDEDTANDLFDVYGECDVDLLELFSGTGDSGLTAEEQACVDDVFTDDNLRRSFVASVTGQELADDPLLGAVDCIDIPDLGSTTAPG